MEIPESRYQTLLAIMVRQEKYSSSRCECTLVLWCSGAAHSGGKWCDSPSWRECTGGQRPSTQRPCYRVLLLSAVDAAVTAMLLLYAVCFCCLQCAQAFWVPGCQNLCIVIASRFVPKTFPRSVCCDVVILHFLRQKCRILSFMWQKMLFSEFCGANFRNLLEPVSINQQLITKTLFSINRAFETF